MAWAGVVTNRGEEMIASALNSGHLVLTGVQTGTGNTVDMKAATALNAAKTTGSLTGGVETDGLRVRIKIGPYSGGYTMKEVGIFATLDNGDPELFALMQDSTGVIVPDSSDFPDFAINFSTFIAVSNTSNMSISVSTSAYVTESEFEEEIDRIDGVISNVIECTRNWYTSTTSVEVDCTSDQKVTWIYASPNGGDMNDATYGAIVLVANGSYGVIHKGTNITVSKANNKVTVTSSGAVSMATVEV